MPQVTDTPASWSHKVVWSTSPRRQESTSQTAFCTITYFYYYTTIYWI